MEIRDAMDRDMDEVRRVSLAAHEQYAGVLAPEAWEKMRIGVSRIAKLAEDGKVIVADSDGTLVGSVVYFPPCRSNPELFEPEWASIRMLSVVPSYRGRGIGRTLSEECLRRAREEAAGRIALHTGERMAAARTLYESMGFEVLREIEPRFGFRYWIYARRS